MSRILEKKKKLEKINEMVNFLKDVKKGDKKNRVSKPAGLLT